MWRPRVRRSPPLPGGGGHCGFTKPSAARGTEMDTNWPSEGKSRRTCDRITVRSPPWLPRETCYSNTGGALFKKGLAEYSRACEDTIK